MDDKYIYCVSYDLRQPDRNYEDLVTGLKSFGTWWHQSGSVWLIVSSKKASDIREYLKQFIDENDKLFVIRVTNNWAGYGFSHREYNWLRENFT